MYGSLDNIKRLLAQLPPWLLTALCTAAILWLTLAPDPVGDMHVPLFPGADKVVHAVMFGGLTAMLALDYTRRRHWRGVGVTRLALYALGASLLGVAVEFAQRDMHLGRSFDIADIAADCTGALIAASLCLLAKAKD